MTLEGIEILNQTEIMTDPGWLPWVAILGAFAIFILIASILAIWLDLDGLGIVYSVLIAIAYIFLMASIFAETVPSGRYKYEATIDESVNFTELYEQYDIVEQRGEIYILEDKK